MIARRRRTNSGSSENDANNHYASGYYNQQKSGGGFYSQTTESSPSPPPRPPGDPTMTCRDRTNEFLSAVKSLQSRQVSVFFDMFNRLQIGRFSQFSTRISPYVTFVVLTSTIKNN